MQETEEIHQPEPVPEAFVPNNESLQTSQTPTDHGITKTEQIQEDAVMAEAGAPPPPTDSADVPSSSVATAQSSEVPAQPSTSSIEPPTSNLQPAQQQPSTMPPRTLTPVNNGAVDDAPTIPAKAAVHGAPARAYLNTKVTGVLLEGMKLLAKEQPEDPLRVLGEYLLKRSKEIEGTS